MIELLSNTGFIMYNKRLAHLLGINSAILLGELCAKYQYWLERGELASHDGWFYSTQAEIQENTALSPYQQRAAIVPLKDCGAVESKLVGTPATTFYRLDEESLNNLLCKNLTSRCQETKHLDVEKLHIPYIRSNKNNNKNKNKRVSASCEDTEKKFVRPTVEEVRAYCQEKGYSVDPEAFCDYYEARGWKLNKTSMKNWKAAVRTWERRERDGSNGRSAQKPQTDWGIKNGLDL